MDFLLISIVVFPLLMAPVAYAGTLKSKNLGRIISALTVAFELSASLVLIFDVINGSTPAFTAQKICGMGVYLKLDGFRAIHAVLASFMWLCTWMFNREYSTRVNDEKQARFALFNLLTLGATIGVFVSADLFTTFIFFEIMSFTSYAWVLHDETKASMKAAETYLAVSVICGMVMLMGLFLLYNQAGTLNMDALYGACSAVANRSSLYVAGALILVGFGAKAGMYPLHIWMPKSYPAAPAPASALLSGILSKAGVFGIIIISSTIFLHDSSWGMAILIIGTVTMFWGGIIALFSTDFKRTVACSSMSQIGFILVGVGMQDLLGEENSLAVRGTLLHMVNHSLFKLVLFTLTGIVFMNIGKNGLNEIKGFGKGKPVFTTAFVLAALGICGFPLFSGYTSKTLLHESIVEYSLQLSGSSAAFFTFIEWIFLISGGLTIAYMLKLFFVLFVDGKKMPSADKAGKKYLSKLSAVFVLLPALLIPILGVYPYATADKLADLGQDIVKGSSPLESIHYFSFANLKGAFISLVLGILIYCIIVRRFMSAKSKSGERMYIDRWPKAFDLETMLYRPLLQVFLPKLLGAVSTFMDSYIVEFVFAVGFDIVQIYSVFVDGLTDFLAGLLITLGFKPVRRHDSEKHKKPISYRTGMLLDRVTSFFSVKNKKSKGRRSSYAEMMETYEEESSMRRKMIAASLSYGLLFAGLGLVIVMLYLLLS